MKKGKPSIVRKRFLKKILKNFTETSALWGEDAQHNERAEWIRREQKRKFVFMDWRPIQTSEIALYLLKAHN